VDSASSTLRAPYDGSVARKVLEALSTERTIGQLMIELDWPRGKVRNWVKHLRRTNRVLLCRWERSHKGRKTGVYQRVSQ